MDTFFKVSQRGSTVANEVVGGLTTFLAMAYIIAVNPAILSDAGVPFDAALTATCFGAAIMTIAMGLIANKPLALASGMGINAIVAYTLCLGAPAVDWRVAMAVVLLEGIVILVLVLCGLRKAIMDAIPVNLRRAIGIGIGLFIAFIGLKGSGLVVPNDSTILAFGDVTTPASIVAIISIAVAVVLQTRRVKGALLISIIVATIVGIPLGVSPMPSAWNFGVDFSAFAAPFQTDPATGTMAIIEVFMQPLLLLFVFSLLMSDFFDTMGTVVAVGQQGDFVDENGDVEDIQSILVVDSAAAGVWRGGGRLEHKYTIKICRVPIFLPRCCFFRRGRRFAHTRHRSEDLLCIMNSFASTQKTRGLSLDSFRKKNANSAKLTIFAVVVTDQTAM